MKRKEKHLGFTITELILAIAVSSILVLTIGVVMVDTQKGWMDSYAKVHGGATADAMMTKAAFDKVIRKASRSFYRFDALDDITVYYYNDWLASTDLDRYARFYRSTDDASEMYIQHGTLESGVKKDVTTEILLASNVADLEFKATNGGIVMKLALDDGREETTVVSTAILHNE
ncbi:MAG: PulJ/GspJ family protein [Planctomycetota bacterium]|jgi:prepilin-type N-terminal cleavage/methylation domain-containing protein